MRRWYVVRSQPHAERRARENLERQGFDVWLPLCRRRRRHARKMEIVLRPLFPRYLFASIDLETTPWRAMLSTFGVAGVMGAKFAAPDRPCVSVCGDGAFFMHANVLGTAANARIKVVDAGALVDGGTWQRIADAGYDGDDCLVRADAGTALEAAGDLVHTGATGTNVGDLVIGLARVV